MNKDPLAPLFTLIGSVAMLAYFGGIFFAGIQSLQTTALPVIPEIVTAFVTAIGATLATHFGAIVGLQITAKSPENTIPPPSEVRPFQLYAAYAYFASLVIALGFWILDRFSGQTADIIRNLSATLPGIAAGVVAIRLNAAPIRA